MISHIPNIISTHYLGNGWSGNTINTVIFRSHGILTSNTKQYTSFYLNERTIRIICRDLINDTVIINDIPGQYNIQDAHNSISLGMDREECLHLSYGNHSNQIRYRKSTVSNSIFNWTPDIRMTGYAECKFTYPTFILPYGNFPLTMLYRDGASSNGIVRIKTYNELDKKWTDHPLPIISGSLKNPHTSNPYWNNPVTGIDNSLHISFVWRLRSLGNEQVNNINIDYARSFDNGITWINSKKEFFKLPITQINSETILNIPQGNNLINQTSIALDSRNLPHIVFYSNDINNIPQYQHIWYSGEKWNHQFISNRQIAFNLRGRGTLRLPMSRPDILIDKEDNVYVIYRCDSTSNRLVATKLSPPNYIWDDNTQILWNDPVGFAEPIIDKTRWKRDSILSLLIQYNDQSNYDINNINSVHPVYLVDIKL